MTTPDPVTRLDEIEARANAADVPALVAALRAVLDLHLSAGEQIDDYGYTFEPCKVCDSAWPCATVDAITTTLNGETHA